MNFDQICKVGYWLLKVNKINYIKARVSHLPYLYVKRNGRALSRRPTFVFSHLDQRNQRRVFDTTYLPTRMRRRKKTTTAGIFIIRATVVFCATRRRSKNQKIQTNVLGLRALVFCRERTGVAGGIGATTRRCC